MLTTTWHAYVRRSSRSSTAVPFDKVRYTHRFDQPLLLCMKPHHHNLHNCYSADLSTISRPFLLPTSRRKCLMEPTVGTVTTQRQPFTRMTGAAARSFSGDSTDRENFSTTTTTDDVASPTLPNFISSEKEAVDTIQFKATNGSPYDNEGETSKGDGNPVTSMQKSSASSSPFFNKLLAQISAGETKNDASKTEENSNTNVETGEASLADIVVDKIEETTDTLQMQQNEKLRVINETRKKDIERRMKKCQRYRMKQYSVYASLEQALEAANTYAEQTNLSTKQEILHWIPYKEQDVIQLFDHIYRKIPMNMKDMTKMLEHYQQAIYNTSLFVIPPVQGKKTKLTKYESMAITNYPKSSLKLLTLLKGIHIGIPTTVNSVTDDAFVPSTNQSNSNSIIESTVVKFVLHRHQENNNPVEQNSDLSTDITPNTTTSSFDEFLEEQKRDSSQLNSPPLGDMDLLNNQNNCHQSFDNYERMLDVLHRTRESIHKLKGKVSDGDSNSKQPCEKTFHIASHLAYHLPNLMFERLIEHFNDYCSTLGQHQQKPIKSLRQIKLDNMIDKFYFHKVAPHLSDYLFDYSDEKNKSNNHQKKHETQYSKSTGIASIYKYRSSHFASVHSYKGYTASVDYYKMLQDRFVTVIMDIQSILYNGSRVIVMDKNDATSKKIRKSITDSDIVIDHTVADTIERELIQTDDDENLTTSSKKTNSKITDRDESSIRPIGFRKRKPPTDKTKFEVTHLGFEAISLESHLKTGLSLQRHEVFPNDSPNNDHPHSTLNGASGHYLNGSTTPAQHNIFATTESSNFSRMVFIDNLPIDISTERIEEVYSRCGKLKSVEIFNQRPDLDPGRLPRAEVLKRRSRQTKHSLASKSWQRPKTPVYGLLSFVDDEGYKKATDESLRIFGMIIQRHPVRSIPSWSMTSLHIEDIPAGHPCIDLEYQLSHALQPDIFVCLNAGQNYTATVGSCDIKFPTFEIAFESRQKLLDNLDILKNANANIGNANHRNDGEATSVTATTIGTPSKQIVDTSAIVKHCRINWMASQPDAHHWWTRQYGFD